MKKCIVCLTDKPIDQFYKQTAMRSGTTNKCKDCFKAQVKARQAILSKNPEWREKERLRSREKYRRLGPGKSSKEQKRTYELKRKERYPEKFRAKSLSQLIDGKGLHKHHWNYGEGFEKDIFFVSIKQHNAIHKVMIYDQERMMYRKLNGELLDSREACALYYAEILEKENLL